MTGRWRRSAGEVRTRERIAGVAREILEREGPEAVSMRRIARKLGITPMAIYHHYEGRAAVLQAIVYEELDRLKRMADRLLSRRRRKDLVRVLDAYLDYARERPHLFDYVYSARREQAVRYPDGFRARRSPTLTPLADDVAAAMSRGELKQDDAWEIAMQLWAHVHGYATLRRAGWFTLTEKQFRALYHRAVTRLLDGLRG